MCRHKDHDTIDAVRRMAQLHGSPVCNGGRLRSFAPRSGRGLSQLCSLLKNLIIARPPFSGIALPGGGCARFYADQRGDPAQVGVMAETAGEFGMNRFNPFQVGVLVMPVF